MAEFPLGDIVIEVPIMNFRKIKKAWPHFRAAANINPDEPMDAFDEAVKAVIIALEGTEHKDLTFAEIEERLEGPQVLGLQKVLSNIMKESGLVKVKADGTVVGNVPEGLEESPAPSTETLTPSSQNLLPQELREEAGTE